MPVRRTSSNAKGGGRPFTVIHLLFFGFCFVFGVLGGSTYSQYTHILQEASGRNNNGKTTQRTKNAVAESTQQNDEQNKQQLAVSTTPDKGTNAAAADEVEEYVPGDREMHGVTCPPYDPDALDKLQIPLKHLPRKKKTSVAQKYDRRANNCAGNGIWHAVRAEDHHTILKNIVRMTEIVKGDFILDWGSGCGHTMDWLTKEYGVAGIGIDVSKRTIMYARNSTAPENMHCVADGTRLEWIPSNFFDKTVSFGSIYHVYNRVLFCHVMRQLVRTVRVGGFVYNGWTENVEFHRDDWQKCFSDLKGSTDVVIKEEKEEFKDVEIFPLKAKKQDRVTYSLLIHKTAEIHGEKDGGDAHSQFTFENVPIKCKEGDAKPNHAKCEIKKHS